VNLSKTNLHLTRPTYKIHFLIDAPKIHTDLLWDLSLLFIALVVVYFAAVFFFKNTITATSKKVAQRKKELSPMISEFLFHEDDDSKVEKTDYVKLKIEIRHLLKDNFNRRVLSEILLDLRKDVTGDIQKRLFDLYKNLELHKDAYKKLQSWKWHIISKGILELTQMQVEESYNLITKFINDKRATIRKQAEIATVSLKHEGINYFLDTTRFRISEWQQLKLLDVMRNLEDFQPPRFKAWLTSSNRHVVLFAIRLIKYYNQNDVNTSIIELTKHKNNQIKKEAIHCIKEFYIQEALDTLEIVFWKSTVDIKISILDAIASIGGEANIKFLQLIENKEANFSVRSKALSAINAISPESILPTEGIMDISKYKIPDDLVRKEEFDELLPSELELPEFDLDEEQEKEQVAEPNIIEDLSNTEKPIDYIDNDKIVDSKEESTPSHLQPESEIDIAFENSKEEERMLPDIEEFNVVYEEVAVDSEVTTNEIDEPEPYNYSIDNDVDLQHVDLHFLPIIIDADNENGQIEYEAALDADVDGSEEYQINEIAVVFEQVQTNDITSDEEIAENKTISFEEFDISEISFLPIVVDDEVVEDEITTRHSKYRYLNSEETTKTPKPVNELDLIFEELVNEEDESETTSEERTEETELPTRIADIDMRKIAHLSVHFEEVNNKNEVFEDLIEPEEQIRDTDDELKESIDFETLPQEEEPVAKNNQSKTMGKSDNFLEGLLKYIPEIELYEQETLDKMELLKDIEELGDEREIPLLLEYFDAEEVPVVKERIQEILKKFSLLEMQKLSNPGKKFDNYSRDEHTSIIEDFFGHCDSEAKLILMDTLVDIIDQKDVDFLNELLEDPDIKVSEKAQMLLNNWQDQQAANEQSESEEEQVSVEDDKFKDNDSYNSERQADKLDIFLDQLEIRKPDTYDIFDIDFEIDTNEDDEKKNDNREGGEHELMSEGPILDCFRSLQTLLIEKFSG